MMTGLVHGILQRFHRHGRAEEDYDQRSRTEEGRREMSLTEFVEDGPTIRFLLSAEAARLRRHHTRWTGAQSARTIGGTVKSVPTSRMIPAGSIRPQRRTLLVRKFEAAD